MAPCGTYVEDRFDGKVEDYLTAKLVYLGDGTHFNVVQVVKWTAIPVDVHHSDYVWELKFKQIPNIDLFSPLPLHVEVARMLLTGDNNYEIMKWMNSFPESYWERCLCFGWPNHPQLKLLIQELRNLKIREQKSRYA